MQPFRYEMARDIRMTSLGAANDSGTEFLAGGTDLLQLLKDGVRAPRHLIDITDLPDMDRIEVTRGGVRLGALVKMSDAADDKYVAADYPVIAQALLASASPQLRNMATIGGNLLQRTRCLYFRDTSQACNKRQPGAGCAAIDGENRLHAVLGGSDHCVATHPSDLAVALVALDAVVETFRDGGGRRIPIGDFHLLPGDTPERENVLDPGELIVAVEIPATRAARRSAYRKVRDRASFEFALASAAVALEIHENTIRAAHIALGGIGTKPWRAREAEESLLGKAPTRDAFEAAATLALAGAKPLDQNFFKIELARRNLVRTLQIVGG